MEPRKDSTEKRNKVGLEKIDYKGSESTLCPGCGHNAIVQQVVNACYELSLPPEAIVKISGIGCSSKAPTYFLGRSHGFNGLHGRMPSLATGAILADRKLRVIGMSGDGDTANIGMGQFKHAVRRNIPMVYIVANNGVYGLTKGQFSATADVGLELKRGQRNRIPPIDICQEALASGATFVARTFAGDPQQMLVLLKAALLHNGTAVLDVISPCVTFNNKEGSPKSYAYGKAHAKRLHDITFIPFEEEIQVEYEPGEAKKVILHDGSALWLRKLDSAYEPTKRMDAIMRIEKAREAGEFITGLIFLNESAPSFLAISGLEDASPLSELTADALRPSKEKLKTMCEFYR